MPTKQGVRRGSGGSSHLLQPLTQPCAAYKGTSLAKEELIEFEGVVSEALPDNRFRVQLENGVEIWAYASGKMQKHRIRILAGDRVKLEMSPYDLTKGRINYRHK